jgi:hypothetical protein
MNADEQRRIIIDHIINGLELPESAYDKAKERYEDLGEWFSREDSKVSANNPHIFSQGSFCLGTAVRPIDDSEEYDLDLACKLQYGITKKTHTQADLKELIHVELEKYRAARGIKNLLEPKHRCWRLDYQDRLRFHIDIVPCIPMDESGQRAVSESIDKASFDKGIAKTITQTAVSITDDRHPSYKSICDTWNSSNPEGYAMWFQHRMNLLQTESYSMDVRAQVDKIPMFKKKAPLQRVIQLLKRHRDNWSTDNPDSKPISIIITTLAARAYNGENNIVTALENILYGMTKFVRVIKPLVPNPVNPDEDFADRWYRPECSRLRLKESFYNWIDQAQKDFQHLKSISDIEQLCTLIKRKFSVRIDIAELEKRLGKIDNPIKTPKTYVIDRENVPKPWRV